MQPDNLIEEIEDYLKTLNLITEEELASWDEAVWCSWGDPHQA